MMEHSENDVGGKRSDPFIDRSKVRILLCDNDEKSTEEVFDLLCKCSYQVTSVRSARQVIDALNAEGPDIDIILSEVDLPMKKGMKMLKYIMTDKELQRIPVIMMSTQDEVSIVVKCLRLGAADYLVKPLRTNELLNLWTHMWRRRRMLGLAEKNILSYDFDMVASDPSDANTNSTTLFSDDTDDKSRRSGNPEMGIPSQQDDETYEAAMEPGLPGFLDCRPDVPGISDRKTGQLPSCPKKSELKIGESSAFFTYVKSSVVKNNVQASITPDENAPQPPRTEEKSKPYANGNTRYDNGEASENNSPGEEFPSSTSVPDSTSLERSCTPPVPFELVQSRLNDEGMSQLHMNHRNGTHLDISGFGPDACFPYYMAGAMNRVMIPSSSTNAQNHPTSGMIHHYNHLQPCSSYVPGMASFPYYPFGICLPPGQMPNTHQWPAFGSSSSSDAKTIKVDRREAALMKFRQKRKERCFDKKIRYVNRKKLAERRPRVHGQFVRKMNGVTVDLNGEPSLTGLEEEEDEEDDDDPASQDLSPEDAAS